MLMLNKTNTHRSEYQFKFDDTFAIHDDIEVLKRMGLLLGESKLQTGSVEQHFIELITPFNNAPGLDTGDCTFEDIERAKTMVPKAFEKFIESKCTDSVDPPFILVSNYVGMHTVYGRGQEECLSFEDADDALFNEDSIIMKTEQMSDEEELLDDDHYSDMSDME